MTNVAINGLGRIGRATLKIIMDTPELNLVAVNDLAGSDALVYLLRYDTVSNCVTPVMEILARRIGVRKAVLTTIHAYTASQAIVDAAKNKLRMGRSRTLLR